MITITINGGGFSFSAQFDLLPTGRAQDMAFEAMSKLVQAEQLLRAREGAKFDVILRSYGESRKLYMIKEIRAVAGIGLKEAKDLSEALPATVMQNVGAQEAAQIAKNFEIAGGCADVVEAAK